MATFWPRSTLRPWQARYETREREGGRARGGAWARLARRVPRVQASRIQRVHSALRNGLPNGATQWCTRQRGQVNTQLPKSTDRTTMQHAVNLAPVSVTPHRTSCRTVPSARARNPKSSKRVFGPPSRAELARKVQFVAVRLGWLGHGASGGGGIILALGFVTDLPSSKRASVARLTATCAAAYRFCSSFSFSVPTARPNPHLQCLSRSLSDKCQQAPKQHLPNLTLLGSTALFAIPSPAALGRLEAGHHWLGRGASHQPVTTGPLHCGSSSSRPEGEGEGEGRSSHIFPLSRG